MSRERSDSLLFLKRVTNKLGRPYGVNPFPRAFEHPLAAENAPPSVVFDKVYTDNFWGSVESRSGRGSELRFVTRYRMQLSQLIRERKIKSIFDAPCGDLNWMKYIIDEYQITYKGGDISVSLIEHLRQTYTDIDVRYFDICNDKFPSTEIWHCRDCLFHLPFADIRRALSNFVASDIPFALLTTHRARLLHQNLDIARAGGFRLLDLERPPFNFPPAIKYLVDYKEGVDFPRFVALWPKDAIERALSASSMKSQAARARSANDA